MSSSIDWWINSQGICNSEFEHCDVHDMCSALFYVALCPHNYDNDDSSDASMLDGSRDNPHLSRMRLRLHDERRRQICCSIPRAA